MCEDVLLAVREMELVVEAVRMICRILTHVPYDDGCFAAKVFNIAFLADYH